MVKAKEQYKLLATSVWLGSGAKSNDQCQILHALFPLTDDRLRGAACLKFPDAEATHAAVGPLAERAIDASPGRVSTKKTKMKIQVGAEHRQS